MRFCVAHVRYWPKADIGQRTLLVSSLNRYDALSGGFVVWTTATSKISILTYREEQDVQDIPHPGGHHDQFEARRADALAGTRRR
jgi:hypothetical protein